MPNIATHGLLAQDALDNAPFKPLARIIRQYPKAYFLGSNGPDLFFYYHVLPWQSQAGATRMAALGNRIHAEKIDAFYRSAIEVILETEEGHLKNAMIAYLAGHLTHWSLDSVAHPYVFYKTGLISGPTKHWHSRLESSIDTLMVKQVKGYSLAKFDTPQLVDADALTKRAVAVLYPEILKRVFAEHVEPSDIVESIASFHSVIKILNDPHSVKFPFVQLIERIGKMNWAFSCHMVTGTCDQQRDILNLNHAAWVHPCDDSKTSNESFLDLYASARVRAVGLLCALDDILFKSYMADQLIAMIGDRTYDAGLKNPPDMIHFDPIY